MKKILTIILIITAAIGFADLADTAITLSSGNVNAGDSIGIEISTTELLEEWDVISFQFEINYDPSSVTFMDHEYGEMLATGGYLLTNEIEPGFIRAAFSHFEAQSGSGVIATLWFEGITGDSDVDIHDFKFNTTIINDLTDGMITVIGGDQLPVADAGEDFSVNEDEQATLDGSNSYDPEGENITFEWITPDEIVLNDNNISQPEFTAPQVTEDTEFTLTLIVNDGNHNSLPDEIIVTVLEVAGNDDVPQFVKNVAIESISPNPFNPETKISFLVPAEETELELVIYSIRGQRIRDFHLEGLASNSRQSVIWDGKDNKGNDSASGVYFCRITGKSSAASARMLLLK